jgi:hypothetical protein
MVWKANIVSEVTVATMRGNNEHESYCRYNMFQQIPRFTLLQQCVTTIIAGYGGCLITMINVRGRQADRHKRFPSVFLVNTTAWGTTLKVKLHNLMSVVQNGSKVS